jgi:hypothetical protein
MLNRIAAAQNYTTKEGFSMRTVTLKALAVGLVGLLLIAAGPVTARAQPSQPPQISVDPPSLNFTGAGSREVSLTITVTVPCPASPVSVTVPVYINWWARASYNPPAGNWLTTDPPLNIINIITDSYTCRAGPAYSQTIIRTVPVRVTVTPGGLREGTYNATITFYVGGGVNPAAVAVTLRVGSGQPGPGQVRLSIIAEERSPDRPNSRNGARQRQIPMELTINPPAGGWMRITTPYFQDFPQDTRIQLVAPASVDGLQFDHWEAIGGDPWYMGEYSCRNFTGNGNTLTGGPLCTPRTTIIAVYVRRSEQPPPPPGGQQREYRVWVLYTTWENRIMADPPMARVQVLQDSPNGQPGQELEFAWIRHPAQAQGLCFRIWVGTEDFMGSQVQNIQNYQQVNCQAPPPPPVPPSSSVIAELTVDRGCGAIYYVGDLIIVTLRILQTPGRAPVLFRLLDVLPDGRVQILFAQYLGEGEYQLRGWITPPRGTETLILQAFFNGQWQNVASCSFQVR